MERRNGKYHKGSKIGEGGCGIVHRAEVEGAGTALAWKETKPGATFEETRRFKREVRIMHQLRHENIMPVLAFALEREPPVFIMPLAQANLRDLLTDYVRDPDAATSIFLQICRGVSHAHKEGIVHRDLKPENILFVDDVPKVSDFGLGRELDRQTTTLTQTNIKMGTLAYMAPEQMTDAKSADHRADIFALGKILFELRTGDIPFPVMDTTLLTDGFRFIVEKATKNRPSDRFYSVDDLTNEIELLAYQPELFLPGLDEAQTLIRAAIEANSSPAVRAVLTYLRAKSGDQALYLDIVARFPKSVLEAAGRYCNEELCDVIDALCMHAAGQLSFSFVDTVADMLFASFYACNRLSTKKEVISRLLKMGYEHNRYYVRDIIRRIVEDLHGNDDIMIFRDAAIECDDCLRWYDSALTSRSPRIIQELIAT
ncbi:MAG TPA: serine/threonine-protein kinase [Armatimonadota bacterium]|nr:serine/threonine-protein kinase [Armatimonadota bacterium]